MDNIFKPYYLPNNSNYIQNNMNIVYKVNNQEETTLIPFNSFTMKNYIISFLKNDINIYLKKTLREEFKSNSFIPLEYNFYYLLVTNIKNKKVNPIPTYDEVCSLYNLFCEEYNKVLKFKEKYGGIRVDNKVFCFTLEELHTYIAKEYLNQLNLFYLRIRMFELKRELEEYSNSKYNVNIKIVLTKEMSNILVHFYNGNDEKCYNVSRNVNDDFCLEFKKDNFVNLGDYILLSDNYITTLYTNIFIKYLQEKGNI